ncbi:MAG: amino acid ABC transporter substrate-binding protein [Thermoleophilia bacterium]|nr:amino acid ABC transporter substrate-binding protein [Thermoleophilia bacterium]
MVRRSTLAATAVAVPLLLAGQAAAATKPVCNLTGSSALQERGVLTLSTDNPAFPPWFGGGEKNPPWKVNDPATGKGYESAVAYEVARRIGFARSKVKWIYTPFDKSFAPGDKDFDLFFNQVSYNPARARNVAFSISYYNVTQAVVVKSGTAIARARSIAALKPYRFGAQRGTTSLDAIRTRIQPDQTPRVYPTNVNAVNALKNGQIDGLVVDLPTAYYVTAAQVPNSRIVGQLPAQADPERFGAVAQKGSPLMGCVNKALRQMRRDKTLAKFEQRWLAGASAPFLR